METKDIVLRMVHLLGEALGESRFLFTDFSTNAMGIDLPDEIFQDPRVSAALLNCEQAATSIQEQSERINAIITSVNSELEIIEAIGKFGGILKSYYLNIDDLFNTIENVIQDINILSAPEKAIAKDIVSELAQKFSTRIFAKGIESYSPSLLMLLKILGLAEWRYTVANSVNDIAHSYIEKVLYLQRIKDLITDPEKHFKNAYKWGLNSFDPTDFFELYADFFEEEDGVILGEENGNPFLQYGFFKISRWSGASLPGIEIEFAISLDKDNLTKYSLNESWNLNSESSFNLIGHSSVQIAPPLDFSLSPPSADLSGEFKVYVDIKEDKRPYNIIGASNSLLEINTKNISAGLGLKAQWDTATNKAAVHPLLFLNIQDFKLAINTSESDNFLSEIIGDSQLEGEFDLDLEWLFDTGLRIKGSGGLEINLPIHKSLGVIDINNIYLALKITENGAFAFESSAGFTANLGPINVAIEKIGSKLDLNFPDSINAAYGLFDLDLGFKPPSGAGLAINTGIVIGGGFLDINSDTGQYHGTFEVSFAEVVSLKVIGIIETKMPDGSKGFSMILIITADFGSGIQLGFGFTLLAVGGLIGLNRSMHLDTLAKGVRTGAVHSVMFPTDVIKNAPRIISDLQVFFPIKQGTFLIGPMAKLGWGTPVLITISLGIIIEIPGNIAILGVLKVVLPDEKAPLIIFQVNFIGAIEFDKQRLWFFASLFDSRILSITLEGEMGLLMAWGNHANFVASLGGFHPAFQPPTLPFPTPKRLSFNLLNKAQAKIRLQGYFAVTSNTVQFGARAELYFGFSVLNVEGHLGFDALFQFSPFYMILQVSASLSVKVFGAGMFSLGLNAKIEGPGPWNMHGKGKIKICWFWKVTVNIDTTWGNREDTTLPAIAIMPILVAEIEKRDNWKANIPKHNRIGVSLRDIEASDTLVLHPIGTLQISQRAIPLGFTLDKLGAQKPKDANKFEITSANTDMSKVKDVEEQFAIAQFKDLKDAEKLAAPSFEKIEGGIELSAGGNQVKTAKSVKRHVRYDLIILDDSFKHRAAKALYEILKILFGALLNGNASSNASVSHKNKMRREPFEEKIIKRELGYTVANMQDNTIFDQQMVFNSHAKAKEYLQAQIAKDPRLSEEIHVLPLTELNSAA